MTIINLSIELPFKIGDKIWINPIQESEKYISIDKYRQIQEFRIVDIKVELDLKTGKKEIEFYKELENIIDDIKNLVEIEENNLK